jgi:hypothetical protein
LIRQGPETGDKTMRRILRRSIVTAVGAIAVGFLGAHSALADGIPAPPPQVQPQVPPPPPAYRPAPPVVQEYVYPPPVVYAYPPPVITYVPAPSPVVVVPRPYFWGGYRPALRVGGPFIAHGYGRPWGGGFRRW